MSDFLSWFLGKHYIISAIMLPEVAFAFSVYQRWYLWSVFPFLLWCIGRRK